MTVKRNFLNIGIILTVIALAMLGSQIYELSCQSEVEVTVIRIEPKEYTHTVTDGVKKWKETHIYYTVIVQWGDNYKQSDRLSPAILGVKDDEKVEDVLKIGDKFMINNDCRYSGLDPYRRSYWGAVLLFCVPGILLLISCRFAFNGYKSEFIDYHPIAFTLSCISWAMLLLHWIYIKGFEGLRDWEGLGLLGQLLLTIIINAIMWIIIGVRDHYQIKKYYQQKELKENSDTE